MGDVYDFFSTPSQFIDILVKLRQILLDEGLVETWKWNQPCYTYNHQNVAIIGTLKHCAVLGFFQGVDIEDPKKLLLFPGKNTRSAKDIRFSSLEELQTVEEALLDLIQSGKALAEAGKKLNFERTPLPNYPEELLAKIKNDSAFGAAFESLTEGRKRAYLLHFNEAKKSETRSSRIEKYTSKILRGKGMNDWQ